MQSTHCCLLLTALLNKPYGGESAHIKTPQRQTLNNQEMCLCMRARQEVAGGIADGDTVRSDNKGKGGAQPFILFGLESGSAIVSLTPG